MESGHCDQENGVAYRNQVERGATDVFLEKRKRYSNKIYCVLEIHMCSIF